MYLNIKNIKWIIYPVNINKNKPISYQLYIIFDIFPLNTLFKNIIWDDLSIENKNILEKNGKL